MLPIGKKVRTKGLKKREAAELETTETEGGSRNEAPETDKKKEFFSESAYVSSLSRFSQLI